MTNRAGRVAVLLAGVVGLLVATAGTADAGTANRIYRTTYHGPFADQASCDAISTLDYDPPDVITAPCFYSATIPTTTAADPGWYFVLKYDID